MHTILLSFQVGFLLVALFYAIRIKRLSTTPNFPYKIAITTLVLMCSWRIAKLMNMVDSEIPTVIMFFITFLWMVFFINIYILIKSKNG